MGRRFEASLEKSSQDPISTEKSGHGGIRLPSTLCGMHKIGGSQSRPVQANSETLSQK
jgi:hypothetical protein